MSQNLQNEGHEKDLVIHRLEQEKLHLAKDIERVRDEALKKDDHVESMQKVKI